MIRRRRHPSITNNPRPCVMVIPLTRAWDALVEIGLEVTARTQGQIPIRLQVPVRHWKE